MSSAALRRADTTKGPPLRILSLDGGGVRGYSMLILLQELMHRTYVEINGEAPKRHEIPKPCDHFDLIVGTGTGGLIAIMLGRLRLDLETCKDVYVRMTRRVFETDKTIIGIPYRSTLFKASKLEEAIRDCVREHTVFDDEGNDSLANAIDMTPMTPASAISQSSAARGPQRSMSNASRFSAYPASPVVPMGNSQWGSPNALLYDIRDNRTKTAVTAMLRGTKAGGSPAMLRSYDSRKEPAPETECSIWQAGRATCAIGLAFKPIQIGQTVFIDEGAGKYNPAPWVLDEACVNEWPGREVGVFVSIGTGKRPGGTNHLQSQWWEGFVGGSMGDFAEARRRLISKIEGCEETHQAMIRDFLPRRQVNSDNYYRLNVEVGVGEFGMNEWSRLSDVSINTQHYLSKSDVQKINQDAATKLARIHFARARFSKDPNSVYDRPNSWQDEGQAGLSPHQYLKPQPPLPSNPLAVELPAEDYNPSVASPKAQHELPLRARQQYQYSQHPASEDKFPIVSAVSQRPESSASLQPSSQSPRRSYELPAYNGLADLRTPISPQPAPPVPRDSPPPLPPKTPIQESSRQSSAARTHSTLRGPPAGVILPYPDRDGPPPIVNKATKPDFR